MAQHMLSLMSASGKAAAVLRLNQDTRGVSAQLIGRTDELPPDGEIWLFTTQGPVLLPPGETTQVSGNILGAAVMHQGACLCAGAMRGARIHLEQEKVRLRMAAMQRTQAAVRPAAPQPLAQATPDQPQAATGPAKAAPQIASRPKEHPAAATRPSPIQGTAQAVPILSLQETAAHQANSRPLQGAKGKAASAPEQGQPSPAPASIEQERPGPGAILPLEGPHVSGKEPPRQEPRIDISRSVPNKASTVSGQEPSASHMAPLQPAAAKANGPQTPPDSSAQPHPSQGAPNSSNLGTQAASRPIDAQGQQPTPAAMGQNNPRPNRSPAPGNAAPNQHAPQADGPHTPPLGGSAALDEILGRAALLFPSDQPAPPRAAFQPAPMQPSSSAPNQAVPAQATPLSISGAKWQADLSSMMQSPPQPPSGRNQQMQPRPQGMPGHTARPVENPFPNTFPRSTWRKIFRPQGQGW